MAFDAKCLCIVSNERDTIEALKSALNFSLAVVKYKVK